MKKVYRLLMGVLAIFTLSFFVACEGPAGEDGVDGKNGDPGKDGTAECAVCHEAGGAIVAKQFQFAHSQHAVGTYYNRTGQCAGCHSSEGFLDRKNHASVTYIDSMKLGEQSPINCRTCHTIHTEYDSTDWKLTFVDKVKETIFGYTSPAHESYSFGDYGNSNMCMQCHQSRDRGNVPSLTSTDSVSLSSQWGPHYGVQGNILHAKAGIHFAKGTDYPAYPNGHGKLLSNACIDCHMQNGDHSLTVSYNGCTTCHESTTITGNKVKALQTEVHDLLFALGEALTAKGVMKATTTDGVITGYSANSKKVDAKTAAAVWNYMCVYQDHSYGVHNPSYVKALLKNTIEQVNAN